MKKIDNQIIFSPSDLSAHISCKHLIQLNKKLLNGVIEEPLLIHNRVLSMLIERGKKFEDEHLKTLHKNGLAILEIHEDDSNAEQKTMDAMKEGIDVIYQARLVKQDQWSGWADFLIKTEKPSNLGAWSYEVWDTKLATETRAGTILQIALYTERVAEIQGTVPEFMGVIKPDGEIKFRYNDYSAYIRLAKKRLLHDLQNDIDTYPEPVIHCDICKWWAACNSKRRGDDHLYFIAGITQSQIKELREQGVNSLEAVAKLPLPIEFKPSRGAVEFLVKLREQARLQYESRNADNKAIFETLEVYPDMGLNRLPEPSDNDIFLDFEGDPMVEPGGLEYLIGYFYKSKYIPLWAENEEGEKNAFEKFMDFAYKIKQEHPSMHIYHYAPYEVTAFKRLMGKYASRGNEIDYFLRSGTFIDLYAVVRQSLRASVERYSIKELERFFGYVRKMDLRKLSSFKAEYEYLLEIKEANSATQEMKDAIQLYNQDDCESAKKLRDWLENIRTELINGGKTIHRPMPASGDAKEKITTFQEEIKPIFEALIEDIPAGRDERDDEQQAKFLLAHMLEWYGREDKSYWWEYYRLMEMTKDEALDEPKALAYIVYEEEQFFEERPYQEIFFQPQDTDIRLNDELKFRYLDNEKKTSYFKSFGVITEYNPGQHRLVIKKHKEAAGITPEILCLIDNYIKTENKRDAIVNFARDVVANGISKCTNKCGIDLLLAKNPETSEDIACNGEDIIAKAKEWALKLNKSILPVQGPPGSGKSHTASHVVIELINRGKKIGVTALSNKVITSLLRKIHYYAKEQDVNACIIQKTTQYFDDEVAWTTCTSNKTIENKLAEYNVVGGTSFFFCLPEFYKRFDYLVVDEAGQLSLIDTLAVSQAAHNLILLGDPQQLKQPIKGVHPDGTDVSALEHILKGKKTMDNLQGLFLNKTFRMHKDICRFDSEMFYEDKLEAEIFLTNQKITGNTKYAGSGLFYEEVFHTGNTNSSAEEVDRIAEIVEELIKGDVYWINKENKKDVLTCEHIKIISPYNAQVNALIEKLPNVAVGTVDKFQGQEAPIIIYSVATSTPQDAPRGMDFLYSHNRFNVAVSRARARFIMVATKEIFEPDCKSPKQIYMANPFCRFLELSDSHEHIQPDK